MYATNRRPPKTLTEAEQAALLKVTGEHAAGFRDHVIFALALGTGLREMEIAGLNVGDVADGHKAKRRIHLKVFKRCTERPMPQVVFLPRSLVYKVTKYLRWKAARNESLDPAAPLFISRKGNRISKRRLREMMQLWQGRAGIEGHSFHSLRHTACTNLYRAERDIRMVQRFARHANITTTTIYAAPTDEDLFRAVDDLPC